MKWYTSDLHFSYEKIINLCNRPFKDVSEMNNKILENFREKIGFSVSSAFGTCKHKYICYNKLVK